MNTTARRSWRPWSWEEDGDEAVPFRAFSFPCRRKEVEASTEWWLGRRKFFFSSHARDFQDESAPCIEAKAGTTWVHVTHGINTRDMALRFESTRHRGHAWLMAPYPSIPA